MLQQLLHNTHPRGMGQVLNTLHSFFSLLFLFDRNFRVSRMHRNYRRCTNVDGEDLPTSRPNLHNPYYTVHLLLAAFPALENSAPTLDAFRTVPLVWEGCLNANATDMELTWVSKRKLVSTVIKRERSEESGQRKEKKPVA